MKDKIMVFIIGLLLGAVIATGAFYVYTKTSTKCECSTQNVGEPPQMPNGQNGTPPEKPDGESGNPPEKPSESNTEQSNN